MSFKRIRQNPDLTPGALKFSSMDIGTIRKQLLAVLSGGYRFESSRLLTWMLENILREMGCRQFTELPPEEAMGTVINACEIYYNFVKYSEPFLDLLGPVYMELASRGHQAVLGQYFTPFPVARMMASMTLGNPAPPNGRMITACDPASGSAVMMLALAQEVLERFGEEALADYSFTCVDLDPICARMSAVQLLANAAAHGYTLGEILVLQGNSLLLRNMQLIAHAVRADVQVAPADHPARLEAIREAAETSLFPWYGEAVGQD